ncbi:hypothetical protein [Bailinhaonella thermotolerans]|uniref:Uncharacterized protein n=1 Tax=Bailinhaonella thermotolerans TaxID=1070861 RepID=A0A3A4BST7_9ACTN|nr:hypothetical protein [Bailinhaonella thermotolerans]RJL34376.1 hypothetical protein D5H75_08025 [Bailinhaonella thermotolerans]
MPDAKGTGRSAAQEGSKRSKAVALGAVGAVSVLVIAFFASQDDDETTADCVDVETRLPDGTYQVVDERYCEDDDEGGGSSAGGGGHGSYIWYYGGNRAGVRVGGGTTIRPADTTIVTRGGTTIQRGGFGGRGTGGG